MLPSLERAAMNVAMSDRVEAESNGLCRLGALAGVILLIYSLLTMVILILVGGQPATAQECFELIQKNLPIALLRLDILTIVAMPVFCLLYAGLYCALQEDCRLLAVISCASAFVGVTLVLSNASAFSLVYLRNQYTAATTEARKTLLLAAGEAVISVDMWHGSAAKIGGLLLQLAGVLISWAMLRTSVFSRGIAYLGLVTHGLDLAHILIGFFSPTAAVIAMAAAGPLYLFWLPLVARRLYQLGRANGPLPT